MLVVLGQSIVGAIVAYSGLQLLATLAHAGLMAVLFVALSELVRRTWPVRVRVPADRTSYGSPHPVPGD